MNKERLKKIKEAYGKPMKDGNYPDEMIAEIEKCWAITELAVKTLEQAKERFDDFRRNWDCDSDAHKYNTPCRVCESEKSRDLINSALEEINRLKEGEQTHDATHA